jgi:hypothetical protein
MTALHNLKKSLEVDRGKKFHHQQWSEGSLPKNPYIQQKENYKTK